MTRRILAALIVAALLGAAVTVLGACAADDQPEAVQLDEDCDAEDYAHREPECGYQDAAGIWIFYPWIVPNLGGRPPGGQHPRPPAGARPAPLRPVAPPARPAAPAPKPPAPVRVNPPAVRVGK